MIWCVFSLAEFWSTYSKHFTSPFVNLLDDHLYTFSILRYPDGNICTLWNTACIIGSGWPTPHSKSTVKRDISVEVQPWSPSLHLTDHLWNTFDGQGCMVDEQAITIRIPNEFIRISGWHLDCCIYGNIPLIYLIHIWSCGSRLQGQRTYKTLLIKYTAW